MCVLLTTQVLWLTGRLESRKPVHHTCLVAVVTPTDLPKSVRNRCVIEVFDCVLCCHFDFWIFCWYRGFCHRIESDLFFFLLKKVLILFFQNSTTATWDPTGVSILHWYVIHVAHAPYNPSYINMVIYKGQIRNKNIMVSVYGRFQ